MIFVTVGTNEAPFDRLLAAVAALRLEEQLVVQYGHSAAIAGDGVELVEFQSFERMVATVRRARAVVTHAGVGSVMVALANGKRPIVVPRRRAFGEAVDDHQLELGRRFAAAGLVTLVERPEAIGDALGAAQGPAALVPRSSALAAELRVYAHEVVLGGPAAGRA